MFYHEYKTITGIIFLLLTLLYTGLQGNERTNDVTLTPIATAFIAVRVSDVSVEDCNTEIKNIIITLLKVSQLFMVLP